MKISTKKLLVNYIIANGNPGITRTELIKAILHLKFGGKVKYDRELYRGYYSGPISGINNYLMNGPAECGLVKSNGRYYAQYFTIEERKKRTLNLYYHKCDIYSTRCWSEAYTNKFLEAALRSYNRAMKKLEKESAS